MQQSKSFQKITKAKEVASPLMWAVELILSDNCILETWAWILDSSLTSFVTLTMALNSLNSKDNS